MIISNIEWEIDGSDFGLPTEVEVEDGLSFDEIADYLSDTYGWLVVDFLVPMTDDDFNIFGLYVDEVEV